MFWDYLENTLQLSVTVIMLLVCLLQYIGSRKRAWFYLVVFFLGTLVSSYHWTAYLLIMGETPNTSDAMIYIGWNVAFLVLLFLVWHVKTPEERKYFHPLMLLPIPLRQKAPSSHREILLSIKFIIGLNWSSTRKTRNMIPRITAR